MTDYEKELAEYMQPKFSEEATQARFEQIVTHVPVYALARQVRDAIRTLLAHKSPQNFPLLTSHTDGFLGTLSVDDEHLRKNRSYMARMLSDYYLKMDAAFEYPTQEIWTQIYGPKEMEAALKTLPLSLQAPKSRTIVSGGVPKNVACMCGFTRKLRAHLELRAHEDALLKDGLNYDLFESMLMPLISYGYHVLYAAYYISSKANAASDSIEVVEETKELREYYAALVDSMDAGFNITELLKGATAMGYNMASTEFKYSPFPIAYAKAFSEKFGKTVLKLTEFFENRPFDHFLDIAVADFNLFPPALVSKKNVPGLRLNHPDTTTTVVSGKQYFKTTRSGDGALLEDLLRHSKQEFNKFQTYGDKSGSPPKKQRTE